MRILAFDPGYAITGWGIVEDPPLRAIAFGAITTPATEKPERRLFKILEASRALIREHKPGAVVVETLFVNKNAKTAGGVYEARGVILAAIGESDLELISLGPGTIKKAVTGNGQAKKNAVHTMVQKLLGISHVIRPDDTADALAGAIAGLFAAKRNLVQKRIRSVLK